ncbi:unnamed protein product, partial [Haemonchus placei]|uniref:Glycosyl transferase n=1 Tax=Haemonchus placei TaxID=6290 RepID=A0A0N4WW26_HAEPC
MIGLETWFYNFSQFFYKASTPEALADIPRPYLEYSIWGLFKGAEISSVAGNEAVVREKCYQIRCDTEPLSMDRFVAAFGFIGWYWKRFQGAVDGINIAIIYSLINAKIIAPRTSPIFRDRVQPHERYETAEDALYTGSRLKKFLAEQEKQKAMESK